MISPGFGTRAAPTQIRILERGYGGSIVRSKQHVNPKEPGFDVVVGMRFVLKKIEEHRAAAILCASNSDGI